MLKNPKHLPTDRWVDQQQFVNNFEREVKEFMALDPSAATVNEMDKDRLCQLRKSLENRLEQIGGPSRQTAAEYQPPAAQPMAAAPALNDEAPIVNEFNDEASAIARWLSDSDRRR